MAQLERRVSGLKLAPPCRNDGLARACIVTLLGGGEQRDRRDPRTAFGAGELQQRNIEVGLAVVILGTPYDLSTLMRWPPLKPLEPA
jgi:hypothetical protein